ncbi:uncharacterized protein LOC123706063 [Colias croceus]|uniref:uncharacterized protein LOC123706063 n=1 Tax=Colias crocea TaxID=72248 RepID=UPI001E279DE6|nr:uncharacterized protein LOC123706063 [Colias croceus]
MYKNFVLHYNLFAVIVNYFDCEYKEIGLITNTMNDGKEKSAHDMCKNHTARSEKDFYRICPSKLSKRELEDLYFALVDNNVDLKKTVNGQREQLKILSTKLQRVTAQRPLVRDTKECCCNCKATVNEQKETIADMKKTNERLSDRVRLLNMRLCSTKQFLKKGSVGARCPKCNMSSTSMKNASTSALNLKANENVRSSTASCQYLNSDFAQPSSPIQEIASTREQSTEGPCDQNKCRTLMEEMKQKIADLQQELSSTHEDYSTRIKRLEEEMKTLHSENVRVRSESTSSGHRIEQQRGEITDLLQRLRICEAQCEQLAVQLRLEKSRGADLEMRAKAAEMSSDIANAIEKHLNNLNIKREEQERQMAVPESNMTLSNADDSSMYHCQFQLIVPNNSASSQSDKAQDVSTEKMNRMSDDSGYTDTHRSRDSNDESPKKSAIMNQIADLQAQLNSLKQSIGDNVRQSQDTEENERIIRSQNKTKSFCGKMPTECRYNESLECQSPSPRDDDYLIRTRRLNSSKSTHEWCTEFERSDAESTIDENRLSIANSIKDKSRRCSRYIENRSDLEYPTSTHNSEMFNVNNEQIKEEDVNTSRNNSNEPEENKEATVGTSSDDFNFTKETIKRVSGKLINETVHEKSDSTMDIKVNESFNKPVDNSFANLTDSLTKMLKKETNSIANVDSKVKGNKYVSTGVDPITEYREPRNEFRDTGVGTDEIIQEAATNLNNLDICEQSVKICTCPISARRGVAMFRSCSGTLRFTTTASNSKFRKCGCGDKIIYGPGVEIGRETSPCVYNPGRRTSTPSRGTYIVSGSAKLQAVSPDTPCDVSSLTDAPSEREVTSPILSPGEEKGTCTQSDLTPRSTTDYGSLSEGELPVQERRHSIGETQSPDDNITNVRRHTSTSEKMEEALRAISDELSRCRHLLQAHTSLESTKPTSQDATSMTEGASIALHKCDANQRIRATSKCVFTLHVGTVILSDQAVLNSRNKSLSLLWRFYDQAPTLTHQLAGRVMHFDFSVEYDVRISPKFLEYLKQIGGPGLRRREVSSGSITAEEAGVLDVWCMLRVPPDIMPAVSGAVSQTLASFHRQASSLERILDADHTDFHLSRDLDMHRASKPHHSEISKASYDSENIYDIMNSKKWRRASALKQTETCSKKSVTILPKAPRRTTVEDTPKAQANLSEEKSQTLDITILWLALNEECKAMTNPKVKRLYVAYSFLGKCGAELETPSSLPKPRNFMDKCHYNFRKSFIINECDIAVLSAMARYKQSNAGSDTKHCIVFSVVSEPPEDPLGLDACEDIG